MDVGKRISLTKKQLGIMKVLWDADAPLSALEIHEYAKKLEIGLNINTVRASINKLIELSLIEVGEIKIANKALTRAYTPLVSSDEYAVLRMRNIMNSSEKKRPAHFIAALLADDSLNEADLEELSSVIEELRKQ